RRRTEEKLLAAARRAGVEVIADPVEALLEEVSLCRALRQRLEVAVETLDPASPLFHAYERALDRVTKALADLHRLRLDAVKRRTRQVELALGAIRAALDVLDLTADQRRRATEAAAQALRGGRL